MKSQYFVAAAMIAATGAAAYASPPIDSAKINPYIFPDFPASNYSSVNNYPAHINLTDGNTLGPGGANLHNWRLSENAGASNAQFANADSFSVFADVTINTFGTGAGEGGLQVSPWWSEADGRFNMRTTDGEIAVFGGRLPFYSFTGNHGLTYSAGDTVRLGVEYEPQGLSMASPGLIRYTYIDTDLTVYTSGWLAFDEGNPGEDPPHGLWGTLNFAGVGGYMQVFGQATGAGSISADFDNIAYLPAPGSAALLAMGGLLAARRRR